MNKYLHLSSLEMDTMGILMIHGKTYGLSIMRLLNQGREKHNISEVGYGSFYPVLKKLEREKLIKSVPQETNKKRKDYVLTGLGERTYKANSDYRRRLFGNTPYNNLNLLNND